MEKYLKTKDNVYEVVFKDLKGSVDENEACILVKNGKGYNRQYYLMKESIIGRANDLKNLVDCIVIDYGHYKHFASQPINSALVNIVNTDYTMRGIKVGAIKVYGAIWCDWGLKYVAKLNDEGDMELLWLN